MAEIQQRYPEAEVTMNPTGGGRFEVVRDGVPVFQKSKLERHAEPGEVVELLERMG